MKKLCYSLLAVGLCLASIPVFAQTLEHLHLMCTSYPSNISISSKGAVRSVGGKPYLWDTAGHLWIVLNDPFLGDSLQSNACQISPTGAIFDQLSNGWCTRSEDGGSTFARIMVPTGFYFRISPVGELFVFGASSLDRSTDEGGAWDTIPTPGNILNRSTFDCAGNILAFQFPNILELRRNAKTFDSIGTWDFSFQFPVSCSIDSNTLLMIGGNTTDSLYVLHVRTDTWERISMPGRVLSSAGGGPLCCDSTGHIYAGINGALMRSNDTGRTWQMIDSGSSIGWLAFQSPSIVWAATETHTFQYRETTHSLLACDTPFEELGVAGIAAKGDTIYAAAEDDSLLFQSTDNGDHWFQIYRDSGFRKTGTPSIQFAPDGATYFTDFSSLYRSYGGSEWKTVFYGPNIADLSFAVDSSSNVFLSDVGFSSDDGDAWQSGSIRPWPAVTPRGFLCYARDSLFLFSPDRGTTWDTSMIHDSAATRQAFIHTSSNQIWLSYDSALFLSIDNGLTWARAMAGLPSPVQPLRWNMSTDPYGHTFCIAGQWFSALSLYGWDPTQATWRKLTSDTDFGIYTICANAQYVFLGTRYGVYRIPIADFHLGVSPSAAQPADQSALAYPNPTSANFSVRFYLAKPGNAKITLYDVLGNVVDVVPTSPYGAGWNSVLVRAALIPSTYIFQVIAEGILLHGRVAIASH